MILNLRISARSHTEQHTFTTVGMAGPVSEWDTMPRFADNETLARGSCGFELSTVGRSSDGTRTYVEDSCRD